MSVSNTTVLITGINGFVGSCIARYLHSKGHTIVGTGRRRESQSEYCHEYFSQDISSKFNPPTDIHVDIVVHCAGSVTHWGNLDDMMSVNGDGTTHVIQAFPDAQFIHISTGSVYPQEWKIKKDVRISPQPQSYTSPYQISKWHAENNVYKYAKSFSILRPHIIYGQGDTTLHPRLTKSVKHGIKRVLRIGPGLHTIMMTHVQTLAEAVVEVIEKGSTNDVYNVTDNREYIMGEVVQTWLDVQRIPYNSLVVPIPLARLYARILELVYSILHLTGEPLLTQYVIDQLTNTYIMNTNKFAHQYKLLPRGDFKQVFKRAYAITN